MLAKLGALVVLLAIITRMVIRGLPSIGELIVGAVMVAAFVVWMKRQDRKEGRGRVAGAGD